MKIWHRTSFWQKMTITFNLILTSLQGVLLAYGAEHVWNFISLGGQMLGNIIGLWAEDKNKNDIPDIIEEDVVVTSVTTTVINKDEPVTSDTDTKVEIKAKT